MIKGFIFDLDGVITDTAELHYDAWKKLSDEMNWEFDRELNELFNHPQGASGFARLETGGRRVVHRRC